MRIARYRENGEVPVRAKPPAAGTVRPGLVIMVVCLALATAVAAMSSLNVVLPSIAPPHRRRDRPGRRHHHCRAHAGKRAAARKASRRAAVEACLLTVTIKSLGRGSRAPARQPRCAHGLHRDRRHPVRDYRAEVTRTPTAGGTHVRWAAWDTTLAGRIVQRGLRKACPQIVAGLVAAAEKQRNQ